jgi:hypothetical protein
VTSVSHLFRISTEFDSVSFLLDVFSSFRFLRVCAHHVVRLVSFYGSEHMAAELPVSLSNLKYSLNSAVLSFPEIS